MPDFGDFTDHSLAPADRAVKYLLDRAQLDANFRWVCGPYTQSFQLLCEAEAGRTGEPISAVLDRRRQALNQAAAQEEPEVVMLRRRVEKLEQQLGRKRDGSKGWKRRQLARAIDRIVEEWRRRKERGPLTTQDGFLDEAVGWAAAILDDQRRENS